MRILFFLVHPSKYHLFKETFKNLNQLSINYDVVISSKDVFSSLLINDGIIHTNLFPKGRKIKNIPILLNAVLSLVRTLIKLYIYSFSKKYDLFITDDVLTILGKVKRVPSIIFTDNDLATVPNLSILFKCADSILCPESTNMSKYNYKRITFKGNKAHAHLSPKYFKPDPQVLKKYGLFNEKYCMLRLVNLNATHDVNNNLGLHVNALDEIIPKIIEKNKLIISSEKRVFEKYKEYSVINNPQDFPHLLANAEYLITDSGSVATEAAVLGVPNILVNSIADKCGVLREMKTKYFVMDYYSQYEDARDSIMSMIDGNYNKKSFLELSKKYNAEADDINDVIINIIMKYKANNKG
jgi:hypothetical protein